MPRASRPRSASRPGRPGVGPVVTRLRDNGRVLLGAYRAIAAAIREDRAITPGRRVAGRQLPHRRGSDPRDPRRSPARLLPPASQALGRTARGASPRARAGLGLRRAHRQPLRPGDAVPVRARLPARAAAHDRRALGGGDHAADRARREPAARRRADRQQPGGACARPMPWPTACLRSAHSEVVLSRAELRRLGAGLVLARVRGAAGPAAARSRSERDARVAVAGRALAAQGTTADELVREEHQRQGAMNVTVRNAITSMRLMSAVDWAELFESVSLVDATLRADSDFADMDFPTRDRYRHAIEELARHSPLLGARGGSTRDPSDGTRAGQCRATRREERAPRAGSRLLPDLGRTSEVRAGARIPRPVASLARARRRARGTARLSRIARDSSPR